ALEDPRRVVGEAAPTEVRMDREIPEIRDPGAAVREREAERACALPVVAVRDLDHEAAELGGLALRALDLLQHCGTIARTHHGQKGLDVLVSRQPDQKVDVVRLRTTQPKAVSPHHAQGAGVAGSAAPPRSPTPPRTGPTP